MFAIYTVQFKLLDLKFICLFGLPPLVNLAVITCDVIILRNHDRACCSRKNDGTLLQYARYNNT